MRGHEYIWTLNAQKVVSSIFLVWSGGLMAELTQYNTSEYDQSYYIWFLQANSEFAERDWS